MRIGIVGGGAMGCLIGSFLAKAKEDVWLVDILQDHVSHINQHGLTVLGEGRSDTVSICATTNAKEVGICDLVIIFTKYRDTRTAIQNALCLITAETVVMTVQNGIGNVEIISEFVNKEQVVFGFTLLGSVRKGPGKIATTPADLEGITYLWPLIGEPNDKVREIVDIFSRAGLKFCLSPDTRERIWKKLCLNASSSMVRAITGLRNCAFMNGDSSPELKESFLEMIRNLVLEIAAVANREGITLNPEKEYEQVISIIRHNPNHVPSALADVLDYRKTEVDSLNGAIVAKARGHGVPVPYHTAIYHLVKIIENSYEALSP